MSGAGAGAGGGGSSAGGSLRPKSLPRWKRLGGQSTLYDLALAAIAIDPAKGLDSWPKDEATERAKLFEGRSECARSGARVRQDIVAATLKAGTMTADTFPLHFFHPETNSLIMNNGPTLDNRFAVSVARRCLQLRELDLSSCFNILDADIVDIVETCRELRSIAVCGCRMITDVSIAALCKSATKLESINLGGLFNLTYSGVLQLVTTHPNRANFRSLDLSGTALGDDVVKAIGRESRLVEEVGLGYCEMGDDVFIGLVSQLQKLRRLRVHWCPRLSNVAINYLGDRSLSIEYVDMQGAKNVSANGISQLIASRARSRREPSAPDHKLTFLNCKFCTSLSHDLVNSITEEYPTLTMKHT